jgi:hypothetical protein
MGRGDGAGFPSGARISDVPWLRRFVTFAVPALPRAFARRRNLATWAGATGGDSWRALRSHHDGIMACGGVGRIGALRVAHRERFDISIFVRAEAVDCVSAEAIEKGIDGFLVADGPGECRLGALASGAPHLTHANSTAGRLRDRGSTRAPHFQQASSRKQPSSKEATSMLNCHPRRG